MAIFVIPKAKREGSGRENAWNSPISARSFPEIEKGNIFSSCCGTSWALTYPVPRGLCTGSLPSLGAAFGWKEHWTWSLKNKYFPTLTLSELLLCCQESAREDSCGPGAVMDTCRVACPFLLSYSAGRQGTDGAAGQGTSAPGSWRHQRTGQLRPFHPGPSAEGEDNKLAFANKQDRRPEGSASVRVSWREQTQL